MEQIKVVLDETYDLLGALNFHGENKYYLKLFCNLLF